MTKQNNRKVGNIYEDEACEHLRSHGYQILVRNYRCRFGELDIIARKDGTIVFIEVKYRKKAGSGYPEESVTLRKQQTICRCALCYLKETRRSLDSPCRFDVIAIDPRGPRHIEDAFSFNI